MIKMNYIYRLLNTIPRRVNIDVWMRKANQLYFSTNQNDEEIKELEDDLVEFRNTEMIKYINKRISNEICKNTIVQLSDEYLLDDYKKCNSVKNRIISLENI